MNILISCAGRQIPLVRAFVEALGGRGRVVAADSNAAAPALQAADARFVSPPVSSPDHPGWFFDICMREEIGLAMSLLVDELQRVEPICARLAAIGCRLAGAPLAAIGIAQDKLLTAQFCDMHNVGRPRFWTAETAREADVFPLIAKPRAGRGSRGQRRVESMTVLAALLGELGADASGFVFQEIVEGEEYGLDIVNDLEGRYCTTFMRRKLAMKNGETDRAVTVGDPQLEALGRKLGETLCHRGPLDADVIRQGDTLCLLDLNIRFGGGYMFSHVAGADLPAAMVAWALGKAPEPQWLQPRIGVAGERRNGIVELSQV
ncbi:MAG: ATP-grasp domain-containing protein [Parvibaculum sp.]|nr:ATP-grasp domain-containing protein [Parvibaculum sp.]